MSQVRRNPSSEMAKRFPASRTTNWTFPITRRLHRHDRVGFFGGNARSLEPLVFALDQLALDLGLLRGELVHPDGATCTAGEELADDRLLVGHHLFLAGELHESGTEQDADVVSRAHHRRDVVRDDEE